MKPKKNHKFKLYDFPGYGVVLVDCGRMRPDPKLKGKKTIPSQACFAFQNEFDTFSESRQHRFNIHEAVCTDLIQENAKLRGITFSDAEVISELNRRQTEYIKQYKMEKQND